MPTGVVEARTAPRRVESGTRNAAGERIRRCRAGQNCKVRRDGTWMRYHFHILDNDVSLNVAIAELDSYEAALERGKALAAELVRQKPYAENPEAWELSITNDKGEEVISIPLSEVAQA